MAGRRAAHDHSSSASAAETARTCCPPSTAGVRSCLASLAEVLAFFVFLPPAFRGVLVDGAGEDEGEAATGTPLAKRAADTSPSRASTVIRNASPANVRTPSMTARAANTIGFDLSSTLSSEAEE